MAEKFIFYYGTVLLKLNTEYSSKLEKIWEEGEKSVHSFYEPYYEEVIEIQQRIESVLKESPNISNIIWCDDLYKEHYDPFNNYDNEEFDYLMKFSSPIRFDYNLSVIDRVFMMPILHNEKVTEKFSIIYNGSTFIAYAPIESDVNESYLLGSEIREALIKTLSCDIWQAICIPPCPLRMKFYVQTNNEFEDQDSMLKNLNEIIDPTIIIDKGDIYEMALLLFYNNEFFVEEFSSLMTLRKKIEGMVFNLQNSCDEIRIEFSKLSKLQLAFRNISVNRLRKKVFALYELLYEYEKYIYKYNIERKSLINICEDSMVSDYLIKYFIKEMNIDIFPQQNIINATEYIENRINADKTNFYVVMSATIGATIAALLGVLFSLIP